MHEFSLILSLLERVQGEVDARHAKAVHRVCISVGEVAGVEAELLRSAFDIAREGTPCASAELHVDVIAAEWVCTGCGASIRRGEVLHVRPAASPVA